MSDGVSRVDGLRVVTDGSLPAEVWQLRDRAGVVLFDSRDGVAARSVRVQWGWSVPGGGPLPVRGESAAWDLAHRHEGSRVWARLVGPWSEVSDGG